MLEILLVRVDSHELEILKHGDKALRSILFYGPFGVDPLAVDVFAVSIFCLFIDISLQLDFIHVFNAIHERVKAFQILVVPSTQWFGFKILLILLGTSKCSSGIT